MTTQSPEELERLDSISRPKRVIARVTAEIVVSLAGFALLVCAVYADRFWVDRHFLPTFFAPRDVYAYAALGTRTMMAALAAALVLVWRTRIGRLVASVPAGVLIATTARILLAVVLALGLGEVALRHTLFGLAAEERPTREEPRRQRDPRLGWVFVPGRTGRDKVAGRIIEYTFDAAGYRVRNAASPVDPARPSILFTGESMMVGHGLTWDESIPGQVQALLGTQSANLAVHGFATDQASLRLAAELPRFRRPVAVVSLFAPALLDRNLDKDRPHLEPGLTWKSGERGWSLPALATWLIPYRSEAAIESAILATREVLQATVNLAGERGAVPLIVVPQFTPEQPVENLIRNRILDEPGLPYVRVDLDPTWRIPWDRHPDARADRAIATAVAARLQSLLPPSGEDLRP